MSVPNGYKQTEAGIIPDKWKAVPLLSVVQIASGQVDPKMEPYKSMTLVAPDHIEGGTGKLLSRRSAGDQKAISGKYLFGPGTVIYSKIRPYLVKATAVEFEGLCSADMYPLIPGEGVDASYLLAVLLGDHFTSYAISVSARSGMPKINRAELAGYSLALPPLSEQTAIGQALSDADALIASLEALAEKKRRVKDGTMHALLTGATRLPGFEGEWEAQRLGEVATLAMGGTPSRRNAHFWGTGHPWVSIRDLHGRRITSTKEQITDEAALAMQVVPEGTLMMSFKLSIGRLSFAGCDLYTNEAICHFLSPEPDPSYLYYALGMVDFSLYGKQAVKGYTLNTSSLKSVEIIVPGNDEQRAIAAVLSDMDAELQALNDQIEKARRVKAGMMQDLLTGSVRLL